MNVLWEKSPLTANEIISSLQGQTDWNPKTVRTLLNRLVQKNAVGVNQNQRVYTFYPLYSQNECQHAEAKSFVERIYSGALKSMLVQFIQKESLSDEEIQELRTILDAKQSSDDAPEK